MAATKTSPATDEPVKRTATKSPTKRPAAKVANGTAPAKRATKPASPDTKSDDDTEATAEGGDVAAAKVREASEAIARLVKS